VIARAGLRLESRVAASPVWLRLIDVFVSAPPAGPLSVTLEKRDGSVWIPLTVPYQVSTGGDLGFLGLGRGRRGDTGTFDVRTTIASPRTLTDTPAGAPFVQTTVPVWSDDSPPTPTPQDVFFLPGPDYRYGPGVPLLAGRVVDPAGGDVDRTRVSATETVRGQPKVEQAMTNADGWFRLPLRWSVGATQIDASRGSLTATATVTVPDDLRTMLTLNLT